MHSELERVIADIRRGDVDIAIARAESLLPLAAEADRAASAEARRDDLREQFGAQADTLFILGPGGQVASLQNIGPTDTIRAADENVGATPDRPLTFTTYPGGAIIVDPFAAPIPDPRVVRPAPAPETYDEAVERRDATRGHDWRGTDRRFRGGVTRG